MERTSIRFLVTLFLFAPALAIAGSFMAFPVKLYIDTNSKTQVLKIRNQGDERLTLQLEGKTWFQNAAGEDIYEPTQEIVFFPKIFDIEKGGERIVRVGYQGQRILTKEKTYRLFIEELPVAKPGELALKFSLRLAIPIFVKSIKENLDWAIEAVGFSGEWLTVTVSNSGDVHMNVDKINAIGVDERGNQVFSQNLTGWYVLEGSSKPFRMNISRDECLRTRTINVAVQVEKVTRDSTFRVDERMCTRKNAGASKPIVHGVTH